jgi:hypothetical protein
MSEEAMGRESIESLRRAYDEWARGDFSRRELFDPNIKGVWAAELPDAHVDQGVEAFFASCREWFSAWEGFRLEAEAFLPAEDKSWCWSSFAVRARAAAPKSRPPPRMFGP